MLDAINFTGNRIILDCLSGGSIASDYDILSGAGISRSWVMIRSVAFYSPTVGDEFHLKDESGLYLAPPMVIQSASSSLLALLLHSPTQGLVLSRMDGGLGIIYLDQS